MCGIVGYAGNKRAVSFLSEGLERLEYRGYDSVGIAVLQGEIICEKTTKRIAALKEKTSGLAGAVGIGHTRWATHGKATKENAHPHLSNDLKFAVAHNGIIENYAELKRMLENEGMAFKSDTDTEVIPLLFEKFYHGDIKATAFKVLKMLKGSFALAILCKDYPDTLIAAKHFSPLVIGLGEGENYLASDISAFAEKTDEVIYLGDLQVCFITSDKIALFSFSGEEKIPKISPIKTSFDTSEKGDFPYFMLKEIYEQPQVFKRTVEQYVKNNKVCFENALPRMDEFDKIEFVACGSAFYAGKVAQYVFSQVANLETKVEIASEYRYRKSSGKGKTLTVAISQSGETADTISAIKLAKERGNATLCIVNVKESSLSRICDNTIYTLAGPEIAVATTKGYLTQLAIIYLLALSAAKEGEETKKLLSELFSLPDKIDDILKNKEEIKQVAKELSKSDSVFFIGRNTDYAVSLEAALKLKEISYIHAESYPAGELKHGSIALIGRSTPVIALCANKRLEEKTASNIKEVTARGGYVIACCTKKEKTISLCADKVLYIPETEEILTPILEVVPFQLLAYYTALYKGCDIDKPRNLAKSVTVE